MATKPIQFRLSGSILEQALTLTGGDESKLNAIAREVFKDFIRKGVAGETSVDNYSVATVDERLEQLERRVTALESQTEKPLLVTDVIPKISNMTNDEASKDDQECLQDVQECRYKAEIEEYPLTVAEVAKKFGYSVAAISVQLKKKGVFKPRNSKAKFEGIKEGVGKTAKWKMKPI